MTADRHGLDRPTEHDGPAGGGRESTGTATGDDREAAELRGVAELVIAEAAEEMYLRPLSGQHHGTEPDRSPGTDPDRPVGSGPDRSVGAEPQRAPDEQAAGGPEDEERLPTISEQMSEQLGGWRGLVESSIPVTIFVLVNMAAGLYPALAGSVGTAVAIAVFRLYRRQPVRHAVNGLIGIGLGAYLAYRSGEAKQFYLPGILMSLGQSAVLLGSVVIRRPLIGYVWAIVSAGGKHTWRDQPRMLRTFQWLTVAWAVSLIVRGGTQGLLYLAGQDDLLGLARIFLSWPIYLGMLALTVWAVRRARRESTLG